MIDITTTVVQYYKSTMVTTTIQGKVTFDENKQFANLSFDGVFKINNTNFAFEEFIATCGDWPYKNK